MYLVLRSRRQVKDLNWENLPLWRRVLNRIVDASSFGLISLLIIFVQLLSELTHWDDYAFQAFAKLLNGNAESIGLVCLFPTLLSRPFVLLAFRLVLPLTVVLLFGVSIGLAEVVHRLVASISKRKSSSGLSDSLISDDESLAPAVEKNSVPYSALALITSSTISILQFFYFGTSLAATEYFFSSTQNGTGLNYVQAQPWMLYSDGAPMRHLSIPWLLIIVFGLPFSFLVCCWKLRHIIDSPVVTMYTGSLFCKYSRRCYWWEVVNVVKKLTIALLIRGVPASNSLQAALIIITIGVLQLLQAIFHPWKRHVENIMDPVGGTLLISSLFASNPSSSSTVLYLILTLDALYITALVLVIFYHLITEETEYERNWKIRFGTRDENVSLDNFYYPILTRPINITEGMNSDPENHRDSEQSKSAQEDFDNHEIPGSL
jgi:hypothetical protein